MESAEVVEETTTDAVTVIVVGDDPAIVVPMEEIAERQHAWDVFYVSNGVAALEFLVSLPTVDVVVVHSQAVGLPVADLLDQIRQRSPRTARVVLSDPSDHATVVRLASLAHQFLPFPVDVGLVTDLVEHVRSAAAADLRDPVRTLVGQVDRLPSPPAMFQRLAQIMASEDFSVRTLADEISVDVGLTGELLKLVNSSFYGASSRVTSVSQAISMIGLDMTRFIVLGNEMYQSKGEFETWIDLDRLADRSKTVALGARSLCVREGQNPDTCAAAYLTGIVSEIGLLVLARIPDISPSIAAPVNVSTFLGAERALFGGDRFEVGSHLLTLWGFEREVIDAVRSLSDEAACRVGGLPWYVASARQLVMGDGLDPVELASPVGANPEIDEAVELLRSVIAGSQAAAAG